MRYLISLILLLSSLGKTHANPDTLSLNIVAAGNDINKLRSNIREQYAKLFYDRITITTIKQYDNKANQIGLLCNIKFSSNDFRRACKLTDELSYKMALIMRLQSAQEASILSLIKLLHEPTKGYFRHTILSGTVSSVDDMFEKEDTVSILLTDDYKSAINFFASSISSINIDNETRNWCLQMNHPVFEFELAPYDKQEDIWKERDYGVTYANRPTIKIKALSENIIEHISNYMKYVNLMLDSYKIRIDDDDQFINECPDKFTSLIFFQGADVNQFVDPFRQKKSYFFFPKSNICVRTFIFKYMVDPNIVKPLKIRVNKVGIFSLIEEDGSIFGDFHKYKEYVNKCDISTYSFGNSQCELCKTHQAMLLFTATDPETKSNQIIYICKECFFKKKN